MSFLDNLSNPPPTGGKLVSCRLCKKEVANTAKKCPQCGAPWPDPEAYQKWVNTWKIIGIIFAILMAMGFIMNLLGN